MDQKPNAPQNTSTEDGESGDGKFPPILRAVGIGMLVLFLWSVDKVAVKRLPEGSVWRYVVGGVIISVGLATVLFAMIYKYVPREEIAWGDVWIGGLVTACLFSVGKLLIGLYLGRSSLSSAYGAVGSIMVLLLWIYYSAQIFLLGAEFTHVFAYSAGSRANAKA